MGVTARLNGGPRDGREFDLPEDCDPPDAYRVPAPSPVFVACDPAQCFPGATDVFTYHRGGRGSDWVDYYATPELARVSRRCGGRRWSEAGPKRWQGRESFEFGIETLHLAMEIPGDESGKMWHMRTALSIGGKVLLDPEFITRHAWEEFEYEVEYMMKPDCAVPGCTEKGIEEFEALEWGKLAGRDVQTGDVVPLCGAHAHDLFRVAPGGDPNLPRWLEMDSYRPNWAFDPIITKFKTSTGISVGGWHHGF